MEIPSDYTPAPISSDSDINSDMKQIPLSSLSETIHKINHIAEEHIDVPTSLVSEEFRRLSSDQLHFGCSELSPLSDIQEKFTKHVKEEATKSYDGLEESHERSAPRPQSLINKLNEAIESRDRHGIKELLNQKFDLNQKDESGVSPLEKAIQLNIPDIVEELLAHGATISPELFDMAILNEGVDPAKQIQIIEKLLEHTKLDLNRSLPNGNTPLGHACYTGQIELAQLLIRYGANVNFKAPSSFSPLHFAIQPNDPHLITFLLQAGANPNAVNSYGHTPAIYALGMGKNEVATILADAAGATGRAWLQQKMLAHRFGLTTKLTIEQQPIPLEGLNPSITYTELDHSLEKNLVNHFQGIPTGAPPNWTKEDSQIVHQAIREALSTTLYLDEAALDQKMEAIENGEVMAFSSGWKGHNTGYIIAGDLLIKCNRGERGDAENPGIIIYRIGDKSKLRESIAKLTNHQFQEDNRPFFENEINQDLQLTQIAHLSHHDQHSGNCTWASAKLLFRAVLYAHLVQKKGFTSAQAAAYSHAMYKEWSGQDRLDAVEQYVIDVPQNDGELIQRDVILSRIYEKTAQRPLIAQLIASHLSGVYSRNQEGETPLHEACRLSPLNPQTLRDLLDQGAETLAINRKGQTPLELACQSGNLEAVKILMEQPNYINYQSALMAAAESGNVELMKYLLANSSVRQVLKNQPEQIENILNKVSNQQMLDLLQMALFALNFF